MFDGIRKIPRHATRGVGFWAWPWAFSLALSAASCLADEAPSAAVDFGKDIRPILQEACFACHGPKKQESGLRFDVRDAALKGGDSGIAIRPGDSTNSPLYQRVLSLDENLRMPPKGDRLSPEKIEILKKWIDAGAPWSDELAGASRDARSHWAFKAPVRPAEPEAPPSENVRQGVDRFLMARLAKEGLAPTPEAEKTTLIRRLSLDLIGLPPTLAEVDVFLSDTAPGAYERLVERLLNSPHYGERWGRHWLDAARYADSDGYEKDKSRRVWFYRDWVIGALNRDLPYDQFVIEQIAGDLLPDPSQDQIVATGFLRNSMINEEGGVDPEQFRMEAMFDRMDAIGKSVLGLTIQCAQCHNHKYDPLTQEDYYRMFAFLNDAHEANLAVYTPDEQARRADLFREIGDIESELQSRTPDWAARMAAWEASVVGNQPTWTVIRPTALEESTGGQRYLPQEDGSFVCLGYAPTKHKVKLTARVDMPSIGAIRLELLNDPNLPLGGPGRSLWGTAALTRFSVESAPADAPEKISEAKIVAATSDFDPPEAPLAAIFDDKSGKARVTGPIAFAIDDKDETAWGTDAGPGRRNQPRKAVFTPEAAIENPAGTILTIYLQENHGGWNSDDNQSHNLGRFRLSITPSRDAVADPLPAAVREILAIPAEQRTGRQTRDVFSYWRTTVPDWREANDRIEALWKTHPEGDAQLVLAERGAPRQTMLLERGDFLKPKRAVTPGVASFLHPLPKDAPANRLSFARWLVARESPTTARAIVNRVWQAYFGVGLVSTSEDLGSQCERPVHPELLDWLAVEFMDQGWRLKSLHRLIVTSAAYRRESRVTPELHARDPENRLLARGPRARVEGEVVRDIALAASGLLNPRIGGPSVFPPAPEFLFLPPTSYGPKVWPQETGANRYRRGLYTFRFRSVPYPALQTFDAPNGDFSCVRRVRSNTPLQALTTLNEPLFVECAKALGARALFEGGENDTERVSYAFRRALARAPTESESTELLGLLNRQVARFAVETRLAEELLGDEEAPGGAGGGAGRFGEGAPKHRLAAWTAVARVILNLDETITKE